MKKTFFLGTFLFVAVLLMAGELLFTKTIATQPQKDFISIYHIDKLFHVLGGAFLAGLYYFFRPKASLAALTLFVIVGATAWEIWEIIFDANVNWFYHNRFAIWRKDTTLDAIADVLGAIAMVVIMRSPVKERVSVLEEKD